MDYILNEIINGPTTTTATSTNAAASTSSNTKEISDTVLGRRRAALAKDVLLLRALHTGDMEAASKVGAMGNFKLASTITASGPGTRKVSNGRAKNSVSSASASATTTTTTDQAERPVEWGDITRGLSLGLNA